MRPVRSLSADACAGFDSGSVGLLFVDGSHRYDDVVRDIELWKPRLSDGASVAFHDAIRHDGVRRALQSRVLSEASGFDRPHFVQGTLFVTRVTRDRSLGRSGWSRRRGRLVLGLRHLYARAVAACRVMAGGPRTRARPAGRPKC